jgi:CheY-like chemotaxis protein
MIMPDPQSKYDPAGKPDILIIDDEPAVLKMLALICSRYGYQTDTAENGEAGLEKLQTGGYRLVLTDIKMPGISGNQILEYVKIEKGVGTAVVGMSGTPWLLEGNFDAVLPKPSTKNEILDVIGRFIKQTGPGTTG